MAESSTILTGTVQANRANSRIKFVIGGVIILGLIAYLIVSSISSAGAYYREVGEVDWSAETETVWMNGTVGFAGPWNWAYPTSYIGASGFYEIKMSFEDAVGNLTEQVYTVEVVVP